MNLDSDLEQQYREMMGDCAPVTTAVSLNIALTWLGKARATGVTHEMSDFGVTVTTDFADLPPKGTILLARLQEDLEGAAAPVIRTRVTGVDPATGMIELEFLQ